MRDARLAPFRAPALVFAGFLVLQAATAAVLFVLKLGPTPARIAAFYRGDPAGFAPAKSLDGLLLVAVPHLVAIPLVLFAAIHVVAFARALGARVARAATAASFGAAFAGVAAGFLVRWGGPAFAWVKLGAFGVLEAALVGWAALLVAVFVPRAARARAGAAADAIARPRAAAGVEEAP